MNILFIKIFFSFISILIFGYMLSFSSFEIKAKSNILGGLFVILFSLLSLIYSNVMFWIS